MDNRDKQIIENQFLKFLMFAIAAFCTGGVFFVGYIICHVMMCDKELEKSRAKRVPLTERQIVINMNKPENLSDEDKQYFYDHPTSYKCFIKGVNDDKPYYNNLCEDMTKDDKFISKNPRFKNGGYFDCWWNEPYWKRVKKERKFHRNQLVTKLERSVDVDKWFIDKDKEEVAKRLENDFDNKLDYYHERIEEDTKKFESTKDKLEFMKNEYEYETFSNYEEEKK